MSSSQHLRSFLVAVVASCCNTVAGIGFVIHEKPTWARKAFELFEAGCTKEHQHLNRLCTPDAKAISDVLLQLPMNVRNSHDFRMVVKDLAMKGFFNEHGTWTSDIIDIFLSPSQPWTKTWCNDPSEIVPLLSTRTLMIRNTLAEIRDMYPVTSKAYEKWFEKLGNLGDEKLKKLVVQYQKEDASSAGVHSAWAVRALMGYLHARVITRLLKTCRDTNLPRNLLNYNDNLGRSALILSISETPEMSSLLLNLDSKFGNGKLLDRTDREGWTAMDWASTQSRLTIYNLLKKKGGQSGKGKKPMDGFKPKIYRDTCPAGMTSGSCSADDGGWNPSRADPPPSLPPDWLPANGGCELDTIDVSQFDVFTFTHMYFIRQRPLLVKGGAFFEETLSRRYTRDGLLKHLDKHVIHTGELPYAETLLRIGSNTTNIGDYVRSFDSRSDPEKDLHYLFMSINGGAADPLAFTTHLPQLLHRVQSYVTLSNYQTQFYIGGALMGSPYHFHSTAINSLVHGKKLWLLYPVEKQLWSNEAIYKSLVRTNGPVGKPTKCVQEAGDLLFVPSTWTHGVICLNNCIGVAHEFGSSTPTGFK